MTQTKPTVTASLTGKWKPYPAYKDSGVEWLGEVPAHWEVKRLKYVVTMNPQVLAEDTDFDYVLKYIDISNVDSNGLILNTQELRFVDAPSRARRVVKHGDTIISTVRTYLRAISFIEGSPENLVVSTGFAVLRPSLEIYNKFLWWVVQSEEFVDTVVSHSEGVGYPAINPGRLADLPVWLPPLHEQHVIGAFLDRETAKTNALIAKKEQLIELLQEKRAALISHAVTKGLDPTVLMKDSGVEWLGEIPAHWEVKRLKFAAKLESGHTPNRSIAEYWENCTIPWVTLNDVGYLKDHEYIFETTNYINSLGIANSSARLLPAGTVILSRDATVGRCGILGRPMATSQHFVDWICHEELSPKYLLQVFRGPMQQEFERLTMGATIRTIGMPDVNGFCVPIPPITEQEQIVLHIDSETTKIDTLISRIRECIEKLKEYSAALISAAVTGKIDVREEIPSPGDRDL